MQGKIAIVTGGASGIGEATCRRLADAGAKVAVIDINADGADALAAELGEGHFAFGIDIGDVEAVAFATGEIADRMGGIDILVNNAAALDLSGVDLAVADIDLDVWNRQIAVNLTAPMLFAKLTIPHMIARGGGAMVHVASVTAMHSEDVRAGYAATKSAILALSRSVAVQYGKANIRSNVVAPGLILSPAAISCFPADILELFENHHMTPRLGEPRDIAAVIAFLASSDAAFVNGAVLKADGGFTAALPVVPALRVLARPVE